MNPGVFIIDIVLNMIYTHMEIYQEMNNLKGTMKPVGYSPHLLKPGEYCYYKGELYGCTPNGLLAYVSKHDIDKHDDTTISVTQSILVERGAKDYSMGDYYARWHGYLTRGEWIEC